MGNEAPAHFAGAFLISGTGNREFGRTSANGFTVFELLLALGLVVVIVAIGASAYETFTVRREVQGCIDQTSGLRRSIESVYLGTGIVPANLGTLGRGTPGMSCLGGALDVVDGRVDLRFGPNGHGSIRGRRLSLTPYESVGREIVWICGNTIPGVGLNALGFASGGRQSVQLAATVMPRYLPRDCR